MSSVPPLAKHDPNIYSWNGSLIKRAAYPASIEDDLRWQVFKLLDVAEPQDG